MWQNFVDQFTIPSNQYQWNFMIYWFCVWGLVWLIIWDLNRKEIRVKCEKCPLIKYGEIDGKSLCKVHYDRHED